MIKLPRAVRRILTCVAGTALACSALAADSSVRPRDAVVHADPALWQLSDGDTTIYLFGTMHMMKPGTVWFDDEVKAAFDRSDLLVMEVANDDPAALAKAVAQMAVNDGEPTSKALDPRHRKRYLAALAKYRIPADAMDRVKPWLVAINLSIAPLMALGYRQDIGAESTLTEAAKARGKPMIGLETSVQQLGYFDALPRKVQLSYLGTTVDELPKVEREFGALERNWARGNADALAKQLNKSLGETPELAQVLLFDRNARWVDWIAKRMEQPGTVFVAVGAGHLAGKGSVVDLLAQRKISVRRVTRADFGLK